MGREHAHAKRDAVRRVRHVGVPELAPGLTLDLIHSARGDDARSARGDVFDVVAMNGHGSVLS